MVMKENMMHKNVRRAIVRSLGRYIAIVAIIALGAGMFVGLRTTKSDMVATGQVFTDRQNMFDLRLLSAFGWDREDVDAISQMGDIADAQGVISMDALMLRGSAAEAVYKLYSIPEKVNKVYLLGGRMPEKPDECLADGFHATDAVLGTTYTVSANNTEDVLDALPQRTYTVVGYVSTPLYMDMSRGNTTLGNGSVASYLYIPEESFDVDYYTEIDVTLTGEYAIYTEEYDDAMTAAAQKLEQELLPLAQKRLERLRTDAQAAYKEGLFAYDEGWFAYETGAEEAEQELRTGKIKLLRAQREIVINRTVLADSRAQLEKGQEELHNNKAQLLRSKADAYNQMAASSKELMENYRTVNESLTQVETGLTQITDGISQIDSGISQLESGIQQAKVMQQVTDAMLPIAAAGIATAESALNRAEQAGADAEAIAKLRQELETVQKSYNDYISQQEQLRKDVEGYEEQLSQIRAQREELIAQKTQLEATKATLLEAKAQIDAGFVELQNAQTQADNGFAAAEAQLEAAQLQLLTGLQEIEAGEAALAAGEEELAEGWKTYKEGQIAAEQELLKGKAQLFDARKQLDDAAKAIDAMDEAAVFLLDRNTNVGYIALDSNSDIVEGVSTVFPAFFLLIAALVCITTMTRMVEEERTQIGTLKALGYGNFAIISKYLWYAGSAAVVGCGLGVLIGSVAFPLILWEAYSIMMLLLPRLVLRLDWPLCLSVLAAYTAVTLFVTWYTCRMSLREVPAELIRPKPPASGKKILLERFFFWKRISFLNKVMLRNIVRYRQRLLMMLVGIGGCTALLLTGFGFRDSIVDIVSYQFEEIMLFDLDVRYSEEATPEQQAQLRVQTRPYAQDLLFYHQSSVEIDTGDGVKDILMIAADARAADFVDFHSGDHKLEYPGINEALLSRGMAENMGIRVGDQIQLRDGDMRTLSVSVCGIYDNYVQNFVYLTPQTVYEQWGQQSAKQLACVILKPDVDPHMAAAKISDCSGVMSVSVNQDTADMVGSMLEALDMIVITIVICAGLLAVIVLYNLTNINITERIREIATIKVLGFNAWESAAYVFKENLLLSFLGTLVGLPGGVLLLEFVMSKIRIDMVWMPARLAAPSFLLAMVLTMLSACFVDFILYFKLEKINMAEALKSVE